MTFTKHSRSSGILNRLQSSQTVEIVALEAKGVFSTVGNIQEIVFILVLCVDLSHAWTTNEKHSVKEQAFFL